MFKRIICALVLALTLGLPPAHAAEWGIVPIFRNFLDGRPQDLIDTLELARSVHAPAYVSVMGWHDLEPQSGKDETEWRLGGLAYGIEKGFVPYMGISIINTVRRDMPDDLEDISWSDPALLVRWQALLDRVQTRLPGQLPTFLIGNEVDIYFEKHPDELADFLTFYKAARQAVLARWPQARVGSSVTYEGLITTRRDLVQQILAVGDAAFFTFYPMIQFKPVDLSAMPAALDAMITAAEGKQIYLQEVGYPSAPGLSSSPLKQAEFFSTIIPLIEARPQIVQANIFCMHDFSPKLADMLTSYYGFGWAPGVFVRPFKEFLMTLGLRTHDGQDKPAWTAVQKALLARRIAR